MMPLRDPAFVEIRNRDLREGQHRNETSRLDYFTTAYFHRPEELAEELAGLLEAEPSIVGMSAHLLAIGVS